MRQETPYHTIERRWTLTHPRHQPRNRLRAQLGDGVDWCGRGLRVGRSLLRSSWVRSDLGRGDQQTPKLIMDVPIQVVGQPDKPGIRIPQPLRQFSALISWFELKSAQPEADGDRQEQRHADSEADHPPQSPSTLRRRWGNRRWSGLTQRAEAVFFSPSRSHVTLYQPRNISSHDCSPQ